MLPVSILHAEQVPVSLTALKTLLTQPELLARSQTYAFTVLGISQLFHAIGMRDVETSFFRMNHLSNKLMIAAFAIGLMLQLLVTEVPYFIQAFGTCHLSWMEWGRLSFLASMALIAHEILILGRSISPSKNLKQNLPLANQRQIFYTIPSQFPSLPP